MHHPLLPVHFGLLGLGFHELIVVIVLLFAPVMAVAIVGFALYFKHRQRQAWQDTVRLALEKGQPIPSYPGRQRVEMEKAWHEFAMSQVAAHGHLRSSRSRGDVRGGLALLAFGLAVYAARPPIWTPGWDLAIYIPSFIGAALLLTALFGAVFARNGTDAGAHPPQRDAS